jgi:small GTP-binding protein
MKPHMKFKLIIIGDSGVGKTCFLRRFTEDKFSDEYCVTIGLEYSTKMLEVKSGSPVKLQIWDTAGQENFRSVTRSFFRFSHAVLLLYNVTQKDSFENCEYWIEEVRANTLPDTVIFLVGN